MNSRRHRRQPRVRVARIDPRRAALARMMAAGSALLLGLLLVLLLGGESGMLV